MTNHRLVLEASIKSADLSHAALPWEIHLQWSFCVAEEFYQQVTHPKIYIHVHVFPNLCLHCLPLQGDEEKLLHLTVAPLCDRAYHASFAKSQKSFLELVVQVGCWQHWR